MKYFNHILRFTSIIIIVQLSSTCKLPAGAALFIRGARPKAVKLYRLLKSARIKKKTAGAAQPAG